MTLAVAPAYGRDAAVAGAARRPSGQVLWLPAAAAAAAKPFYAPRGLPAADRR